MREIRINIRGKRHSRVMNEILDDKDVRADLKSQDIVHLGHMVRDEMSRLRTTRSRDTIPMWGNGYSIELYAE